jgi:hypothetical protein
LTRTQVWRLSLAAILGFGWLFLVPLSAYATCVNFIQSQTIAAAYEGDAEPTVHHMDTCSGDDISYQIPIASTITFDGQQYSNIYATTNSVITFGQPDGTFHTYPSTPSISLYSMDWYPGVSGTSGLDIYYSEGGFQLNLNMVPFGNYGAQPSTVNILVAITNTGGLAVSYSYQGPEYQNLRTGVRLHDGSIVSLEAWGATPVSAEEPLPTLQAQPVADPTQSPEPEPTTAPIVITPEEQQAQVAEATQLANDISNLNNLIAAINGEELDENPEPEPTENPTPEPEPSSEPTTEPEPDVEVEPEVITPEDPRFPDDEPKTEPEDPNPSPSSDTTDGESEDPNPEPEPSEEPTPEPSPQPTDTDQDPTPEPEPIDSQEPVDLPSNDDIINEPIDNSSPISEEELKSLNKLIGVNDAKLAAELSNMLTELSPEQEKEVAKDLGIKTEEVALIAEIVKENPVVAVAIVEFASRLEENIDAPMPYTLADATTEIAAEQFLADPIGALTNIDLSQVLNPSEWGKDMTDDQREKAQEVIVPVIIASNIIAAAMTRRIG